MDTNEKLVNLTGQPIVMFQGSGTPHTRLPAGFRLKVSEENVAEATKLEGFEVFELGFDADALSKHLQPYLDDDSDWTYIVDLPVLTAIQPILTPEQSRRFVTVCEPVHDHQGGLLGFSSFARLAKRLPEQEEPKSKKSKPKK